jgi:adenine deaminase
MSDLILPASCRPAQIAHKERVCVLTHIDTGRILCFCMDDAFASTFEHSGYLKHEIHHAAEYDMWAKRLRQQVARDNEAEDHAYLEREDVVRKRLR